MWPPPDDPATIARMRTAHAAARTRLSVASHGHYREAWGWHGRTLGKAVSTDTGPGWLRLAAAPLGHAGQTFWNGAVEAEAAMPASLPRPRLLRWYDWHDSDWQYRAELYEHISHQPVSASPVLTSQPQLPAPWWAAVRAALSDITGVRTSRHTITRGYLRQAMPRFLGTDPPVPWTTAHGDFHFANVTAPTLQILDFEGWGLAPYGYDAATLHTYSLLSPATAARIRREFAGVLCTPIGQHAELVAITELLDAAARGEHAALVRPVRDRASLLLGRAIPGHTGVTAVPSRHPARR
jgi:hypothetical protein